MLNIFIIYSIEQENDRCSALINKKKKKKKNIAGIFVCFTTRLLIFTLVLGRLFIIIIRDFVNLRSRQTIFKILDPIFERSQLVFIIQYRAEMRFPRYMCRSIGKPST